MADSAWPDDRLIVAAQGGDVDALTALVMVADALGLSTAAMKSRLHRARAAVRQTLDTTGGQP